MRAGRLRLLVIGGYGVFGGRLARLLEDDAGLTLVLAGRSHAKARQFASTLSGKAAVETAAIDRDGPLAESLATLRPHIVVDASGPFQHYGERPYRVAEAAIAAGADYLDLADGSEFVRNIDSLDDAAIQAGVCVLSGVSTCPVLSAAVFRRLALGIDRVDSVSGGIAPAPGSGVGPSVIRASAAYAGQPVAIHRNGHRESAHPFTETMRYTVAPPGHRPLGPLTYSLVDVPDLTLLGELEPPADHVWFGAAPVPAMYHAWLRGLARCVKAGLLRSITPLAPAMTWFMNHLTWGERRSGMFLEVRSGAERRSWHLIGEGGDGRWVPAMPCAAIIRRIVAGHRPQPGARPASGELELADIEAFFSRFDIHAGERGPAGDQPLFHRVLGDAWQQLPEPIRRVHDVDEVRRFDGIARVVRGRSTAARLIARLIGFPPDGESVDLEVTMTPDGGAEAWARDFGGHRFRSRLSEGSGRMMGLLRESFGPFHFGISLELRGDRLHYAMRKWCLWRLPMPGFLLPRGRMFERAADGRFWFHVEIRMPLAGHVVTYAGWLDTDQETSRT